MGPYRRHIAISGQVKPDLTKFIPSLNLNDLQEIIIATGHDKISRVLRLQAVKGLMFPSFIPPALTEMLLPSLIFPPHSSPSCQFFSPPCSFPLEKSAWLLLCDIFLVCQAVGCLYWIISQSKSRARGALGAGSDHIKLSSLRHQKYKWTGCMAGGMIERKAQSQPFIVLAM